MRAWWQISFQRTEKWLVWLWYVRLISKAKDEPGSPSTYGPLYMLNTIVKVMKNMVRMKLWPVIREAGNLVNDKHGFREGASTINAIYQVVKIGIDKCNRILDQTSCLSRWIWKKHSTQLDGTTCCTSSNRYLLFRITFRNILGDYVQAQYLW